MDSCSKREITFKWVKIKISSSCYANYQKEIIKENVENIILQNAKDLHYDEELSHQVIVNRTQHQRQADEILQRCQYFSLALNEFCDMRHCPVNTYKIFSYKQFSHSQRNVNSSPRVELEA